MMDGTYQTLFTVRGKEYGATITLKTSGSNLEATVKVGGFPRQKGTGTVTGNSFHATGSVKIPLVLSLDYEIAGTVQEELLEADVRTSKGNLHILGVRV
ncbi:MAG TPA: hypothetical protein DCP91_01100 [Eggerthellaceae bacterium]|nr:hypothetical protein [Eggerthellaceae bacterium]